MYVLTLIPKIRSAILLSRSKIYIKISHDMGVRVIPPTQRTWTVLFSWLRTMDGCTIVGIRTRDLRIKGFIVPLRAWRVECCEVAIWFHHSKELVTSKSTLPPASPIKTPYVTKIRSSKPHPVSLHAPVWFNGLPSVMSSARFSSLQQPWFFPLIGAQCWANNISDVYVAHSLV